MSSFSMDMEGFDDALDITDGMQSDVQEGLETMAYQLAEFLKEEVESEIENRSVGDSVMTGFSNSVSIPPLEEATKRSEASAGADQPSKPLVFNKTMMNSVEIRPQSSSEFRVGIFSKEKTNGMAVKDYAIIQEHGYPAGNIPPRPFLRPAFFGNIQSMKAKIESFFGMPVEMKKLR